MAAQLRPLQRRARARQIDAARERDRGQRRALGGERGGNLRHAAKVASRAAPPLGTLALMTREFVASRWTRGNFLFPTRIRITDQGVVRHKRSWFSKSEENVHARNIANVNVRTGLIWSDIRIETSGGSDPLDSHGHSKGDAREIQRLIQALQASVGGAAPPLDSGDTRACPFCAETIKKAAKICRYCSRELA
ncbi:MAG: hypothetical protein EPO68_05825 [Planctomycetota bacterium]|nr:MAG: hypothetical protein EPO68_05825 [Planctomycetota bacterium]